MFRFLGLHHVQIAMPAGGEQEARAFYRDVLGLEEVSKPAGLRARGGCWFRSSGVELHLGVEDAFTPARKAHPALVVDDLDALERRLRDRGHEILTATELDGYRRFHSSDPFGNRLEFLAPVVDCIPWVRGRGERKSRTSSNWSPRGPATT